MTEHRHWRQQLQRFAESFFIKGRFFDVAKIIFETLPGKTSNVEWLRTAAIYKLDLIDDAVEHCTLVNIDRGRYSLFDMNIQVRAIELEYNLSELEAVLAWLVNVQAKEVDLPFFANAFLKASSKDTMYSTRALACIRLFELFQVAGMKGLKPDARMPKWSARLNQAIDKKQEINAILKEFYEIGSLDGECDRAINHLFGAIFK